MGSFLINTLFDKTKSAKYSPVKATITSVATNKSLELVFFEKARENKLTLYQTYKNIEAFKRLIFENDVYINDFKQHIKAFELPFRNYEVYDFDEAPQYKKEPWRKLRANSLQVYSRLEDRKVYVNDDLANTVWELSTFSGRSKNLNFNLQGLQGGEEIYIVDGKNEMLVNFDWMAADIRICQLMSQDDILEDAFLHSDPYTKVLEIVDNKEFTRNEAKLGLISGINSTDHSSIIVNMFPKLASWLKQCQVDLDQNGYLESILGRRFSITEDRGQKSVINAIQQGSVAHAMQNVMIKVWDRLGINIVAETHDSLTVSTTKNELKDVIESVAQIMCRPFDGLLESNPMFPVQVRVGKKFKKWLDNKITRRL